MSLFAVLPPPKHKELGLNNNSSSDQDDQRQKEKRGKDKVKIPLYGKREHSNWIPQTEDDFADGGAYPEIFVSQFPMNMGRKSEYKNASGNVVSVQVDADGNVNFDKIITQGQRKDALTFTKFSDMIGADVEEDELAKPTIEETSDNLLETKKALELRVGGKITAAHIGNAVSRSVAASKENQIEKRQFFRYKPRGGTDDDIKYIQIEEAPTDPVEPAKFRMKKMPTGPPSPPPTVMHSPPRNLTKTDQDNWDIPPCISNYTNRKGLIIPLDKRILADGRNLQQSTVNPKFGDFTSSLYLAEHNARLEIKERAEMQMRLNEMEQERELQRTRELANRAKKMHKDIKDKEDRARVRNQDRRTGGLTEGRSVSEKVNFNQPQRSSVASGEVQIDSRLLNRASGLKDSFDDDDYNVYDKALFGESNNGKLYNPNMDRIKMFQELDENVNMRDKFETEDESSKSRRQAGPVVFERDGASSVSASKAPAAREEPSDDDPFGFSKFLKDSKKRSNLDHIGQRGFMKAAAGSSSLNAEDYRDSKKKKMEFTSSKE
ncbi:predicted protein [Naegleria gruberi]|uniref:Predicted protein n=1 Tax=Naegleria gruberi TaxID=5762 RepID=D2VK41_NAEGR|nr:uncharacterized protein NAEGRDRAFT_69261 [Naegleria gruberi]EFC42881.1 predicted protein [Naegleria gruberi]|eukprot:XP_002675625.1 predicted protein [Naegleria gruberi strain NEG-M]